MLGWVFVIGGILLIVYTKKVGDFTGEIGFAEKYLGRGGTYSFIKLVGLAMIFFGFAWMSGGLKVFLWDKFGVFFGKGTVGY